MMWLFVRLIPVALSGLLGCGGDGSPTTPGPDGTDDGDLRRITTDLYALYPSWSPDGNTIAFVRSGSADVPGLYTIPAAGGTAVLLKTGNSIQRPAWSPNGAKIGYLTNTGAGAWSLYVIPASGGTATLIESGVEEWCWSPDGAKIAFAARRQTPNGLNHEIWIILATGGPATNLTSHSAEDRAPTWSPDGRKIAFASLRDGGRSQIWVVPATGGAAVRLTNDEAWNADPVWSPAGNRIAYFAQEGHPAYRIRVIPATGGSPVTVVEKSANPFPPAAWSPDGGELLFCATYGDAPDLWAIAVE